MKEKAEDEDENEDDGCRRGLAPATDYRLLRAEDRWNLTECHEIIALFCQPRLRGFARRRRV